MKRPLTLPCARDDLQKAIEALWPPAATARGVDSRDERAPRPVLDGHMGVGFSIRLFSGRNRAEPDDESRASYLALEDLLRALEDMGFEVTRDGNEYQSGRLVLGWAACRRAYDTTLIAIRDLHAVHGSSVERQARLHRERAERDRAAERPPPSS